MIIFSLNLNHSLSIVKPMELENFIDFRVI